LGLSANGVQIGYSKIGEARLMRASGNFMLRLQATSSSIFVAEGYGDTASAMTSLRKARGTAAAPAVPLTGDTLGTHRFEGWLTGTTFGVGANINVVVTETTWSASSLGIRMRGMLCPPGSATLSEVWSFAANSGLTMFGAASPSIDTDRGIQLRSTTVAAQITPASSGRLFFHSTAQAGNGEVAVDTGTAYRHAGQAGVKRLSTNADASYTPRVDGRIVRDVATLTADHALTLLTTNVTDGHKVEFSRRGSSGGHNRNVYQADGTTLIAAIADNANADFIYDATAALWFQK
jgi:hypothetical protein